MTFWIHTHSLLQLCWCTENFSALNTLLRFVHRLVWVVRCKSSTFLSLNHFWMPDFQNFSRNFELNLSLLCMYMYFNINKLWLRIWPKNYGVWSLTSMATQSDLNLSLVILLGEKFSFIISQKLTFRLLLQFFWHLVIQTTLCRLKKLICNRFQAIHWILCCVDVKKPSTKRVSYDFSIFRHFRRANLWSIVWFNSIYRLLIQLQNAGKEPYFPVQLYNVLGVPFWSSKNHQESANCCLLVLIFVITVQIFRCAILNVNSRFKCI